MIGEEIVGARYFIAGHVAGNATGRCPGTRFRAPVARASGGCSTIRVPRCAAGVTREALRVVSRRLVLHFAMWIVAGDAPDARVRGIVAAAVGQPVRLEAHIVDIARTV